MAIMHIDSSVKEVDLHHHRGRILSAALLFPAPILCLWTVLFCAEVLKGADRWAQATGQLYDDVAYSVATTPDGGFVVAGKTYLNTGNADIWVAAADPGGNILWQKMYGSYSVEEASCMEPTSDGGIVVTGHTYSFGAGHADIWVLKLSALGKVLWQKTYGGKEYDWAKSILETEDGGFLVAWVTDSFGAGMGDILLIKLDAKGNVKWQRTYGTAKSERVACLQKTADGGYILVGELDLIGTTAALVLKLDAAGNRLWDRTLRGGQYTTCSFQYVEPTTDQGCVLAGYTSAFGVGVMDVWVVRLNPSGGVIWQKTYGGSKSDRGSHVLQTDDGGLLVTGHTYSFGAGYNDVWLLKLKSAGAVAWQKTYGGDYEDVGYHAQRTDDGGFAVVGYTNSFLWGSAFRQNWLMMRLSTKGEIDASCGDFVNSSQLIQKNSKATVESPVLTVKQSTAKVKKSGAKPVDSEADVKLICSGSTRGH